MSLRPQAPSLKTRLFDALRRGHGRRTAVMSQARPKAALVAGLAGESLEDRTMLTAYVVDSASDGLVEASDVPDGTLTLREALIAANTDAAYGDAAAGSGDDDTISLAGINGETITLQQGELEILETLVLEGEGVTIDAGGLSRVIGVETDGRVELRDLTITGGQVESGAGLFVTGGGNLVGFDLTITGNTANGDPLLPGVTDSGSDSTGGGGGGVYVDGGSRVRLQDSFVTSNAAAAESGSGGGVFANDGTFIAVDTEITGNSANRAGGGIEVGTATTALRGVLLSNNTTGEAPGNGGGLHVTGDALVTIDDSDITSNSASAEGGGLWNSADGTMVVRGDTTITANVASGDDADQGGGGIYNDGGTLTLNGTSVGMNLADGGSGSGGGLLSVDGDLILRDVSFTENIANRAGGGIEIIDGTLRIFDSELTGNETGPDGSAAPGNGGALHVTAAAEVAIRGTEVSDNTAAAEGGGLWNSAGGFMAVLRDSLVSDNVAFGDDADQGGGGLFNDGGTFFLLDSTVQDNSAIGASGSGGGLLSVDGMVRVGRTDFLGNSANRAGGGIEIVEGMLTVTGGVHGFFDDGTGVIPPGGDDANVAGPEGTAAPGNGGFLHITGAATTEILDAVIAGNFAGSEGGGVWNSAGGRMRLRNTDLLDNEAAGDAADNGGGGAFNDGGTLIIEGGSITGNAATGDSGSGGGVLSTDGTLFVRDAQIAGNAANRAGGGVEVIAGRAVFDEVTLGTDDDDATEDLGNVAGPDGAAAPGNGGGLHVSGEATTTFRGGSVNGNTAAAEGGGLWNSATGTMRVTGTEIAGNTASGDEVGQGGGGIYDDGGRLIVRDAEITGNVADGEAGSGGGLLVPFGTTSVFDTEISDNEAVRAGGGIETNTGDVFLSSVDLTGNAVGTDLPANPGNGGGLHTTGEARVRLRGGTVTGNSAGNEGGGLWFAVGTVAAIGGSFDDDTPTDISGNSAATLGGGIFNLGTLTAGNASITGNAAGTEGGGVFTAEGASSSLADATIADNTPDDLAGPGDDGGDDGSDDGDDTGA